MRRGWRPDLYVVARFLDKLGQDVQWSKGKLQPAVRLNYDLFIRYLDELERRGLVERLGEGREERIQITAKGRSFGRRIQEWIEQVFGTQF